MTSLLPKMELPTNVVWEPVPGIWKDDLYYPSSQELAIESPCHETLYHGSRGPGKTLTQLMKYRRRVGLGYGRFWRGVIFDITYKNLDDLVNKSTEFFYRFGDGAEFLSSKSDFKWRWTTGEELLFRSIETEEDYNDYHGHEYPFIGWNELTKQPTPKLYDLMLSCNRWSWTQEKNSPKNPDGSYQLEQLVPECFSTTNSSGPGHAWVKSRFIDAAPPGVPFERTIEIDDAKTRKKIKVVRTQVHIFGSYKENPYLPPEYIAGLHMNPDENKKKSWLEGSWDITSGGGFDDIWDRKFHVVPRFAIPSEWMKNHVLDWGSYDPFHVGWWAEANGEIIELPLGRTYLGQPYFAPRRGSIILFKEWYGSQKDRSGTYNHQGLRLPASTVAVGILQIEKALQDHGWAPGVIYPGPADRQIKRKIPLEKDKYESIETKMAEYGVRWSDADQTPGSRTIGLELFRERLLNAISGEGAAVYVMDNCDATISILPTLPLDPDNQDDIDGTAPEHCWDTARYRTLKGNRRKAESVRVRFPS